MTSRITLSSVESRVMGGSMFPCHCAWAIRTYNNLRESIVYPNALKLTLSSGYYNYKVANIFQNGKEYHKGAEELVGQ